MTGDNLLQVRTESAGRVAQLWRYPVKSMGGHRVGTLRLGRRGAHADRLWAVRDVADDVTISARSMPVLLTCTARYEREPDAGAGPGTAPPVVVTLPDGRELSGADPAVHDALSELVDRRVRLVPLAGDGAQHRLNARQRLTALSISTWCRALGIGADERLPDLANLSARDMLVLTRYSTPPGAFHDLSPVHVVTTASLRTIAAHASGSDVDVRRFRPTVLLDHDEGELPEAQWSGHTLHAGNAGIRVVMPTVRCVVPSRAQPGLDVDRAVSRALTERAGRFLGAYADVTVEGELAEGDECRREVPRAPGVARRAARRGAGEAARITLGAVRSVEGRLARN